MKYDPGDCLAAAVEGDQLAYAPESLGASEAGHTEPRPRARPYWLSVTSSDLARLLERRAAIQVVTLREHYGLSWRRMYDSSRRHLSLGA
ncbi:hypothetical protein [Streptomyces sp. NPDC090994]|uniref:hypothetical protein n=1 Tax=Streptomyces sp. NPDC090994 TaxID=3365969 RepID=UPI0037F2DE9D